MAGINTEKQAQEKFNSLLKERTVVENQISNCDLNIDSILEKSYYPQQDSDIKFYLSERHDYELRLKEIEKQLKDLVDNFEYCLNNELTESKESKAKKLFTSPEKSRIKTFAILTSENPDKQKLSAEDNYWRNVQLKNELSFNDLNKLEKELAIGAHPYYKVKGMFDNVEHSFLIYNISLEDAKLLSSHNGQQSFIYGRNDNGKLIFEFWANKSTNGFSYKLLDKKDMYLRVDDAENYYTQIAKDFKINIPFDKFEWSAEDLEEWLERKGDSAEELIAECLSDNINGKTKYADRIKLYRGE